MAKQKTRFRCQECGYESPKWMGKCPGCQEWNTLVEELVKGTGKTTSQAHGSKPVSIQSIQSEIEPRMNTRINELNRVLGGGIVPGSLVLVGGDPGIGKSTLLLETSHFLAKDGRLVLYISGEESVKQTKLRAERLSIDAEQLYVLAETDLLLIENAIAETRPSFIVVDSIQTIYHPEVSSAPGSVSQVRECTSQLMHVAKKQGVAVFIVGHVTKEGAIAGPRLLEHMVDAVLYFEGERHHAYRLLRAVKNRFGSTNELGVFEMKENGLAEVANPSEIFLEERSKGVSGSTVVPSLEGTRTIMVEIQALISPTSFGNPRRTANGIDHNRVSLLMAVLEKRVGLLLQNQDAYLNVAGGVRLDEPAIDLAIAVSIASSFRDLPTNPSDVIIGEVGLTGEVRRVSRIEQRVNEAMKLGFTRAIIPKRNLTGWTIPKGIRVDGVETLSQTLEYAIQKR